MVVSRHIDNTSIIIDNALATKNNGFLNLEIESDYKIVIDCYNYRIFRSYLENMYKKANRITNCLAKKKKNL